MAALFAIHPAHVESVAWVAERKDVLSAVFFILTLWAYARYARSDRFSWRRYTTVLVLFALGLMCKPTLVTLPFVLLLLDYWPLGRVQNSDFRGQRSAVAAPVRGAPQRRTAGWLHLIVEKIPLLVLSGASCVATILAQKEAFAPTRAIPLQERVANAVVAYVEYLGQAIYPAHLAVLYPYPEGSLSVAQAIVALVFLLIVSVIFFVWRKAYPFAVTGWFWFVGMLVPMIGIVQVGSQPRADRYTYLPEIGLYIVATWGAMELFKRWQHKREVFAVALLIIGAFVTRSYFQTSYWRNSETLWRHTVDITSRNYIAHNNLAGTLLERGQFNEAIAQYRKTLELDPSFVLGSVWIAQALEQKQMYAEALAELERARKIDNWSWIVAEIGCVNAFLGKRDEARKIIADLTERATHEYIDETLIVYIFAALGDKDQAFTWMEKGYQSRASNLPWLVMEPKFDPLRSDPRFGQFVRRIGLSVKSH